MENTPIDDWRERVSLHHAQSEAAQQGPNGLPIGDDFWRPLSELFRPPKTSNRLDLPPDPLVERIAAELGPGSTLLDVGGGAGRLALPLARRCKAVTVVEPSEGMLEVLRESVEEAGVTNLTEVAEEWEDARVDPADVVLCSHVVYTQAETEGFVRKLEAHALKAVMMPTFMDGPQAHLGPLWKAVYGEERIALPGLRELMAVLWEMGIHPDVEMIETLPPTTYRDLDSAVDQFRMRLYVRPGGERDADLRRAAEELLVRTEAGYMLAGTEPRRVGLISWGR